MVGGRALLTRRCGTELHIHHERMDSTARVDYKTYRRPFTGGALAALERDVMRRPHRLVFLALASILTVGSATTVAAMTTTTDLISTTFTADGSSFPNPDRGFYHEVPIVSLSDGDISAARAQGVTLLHGYVRLDAYRSAPIPQTLLDSLGTGLAKVRAGGMKVILRFTYNFGPYPDSEPDASEGWITTHLGQLRPLLADNADVVSSFQAGFIGAWGEWHTSTHGYDTDTAAKNRILTAILANFPPDRQVALRYPSDLRTQLPLLSPAQADRIGNHQDCFGASDPDDFGTWQRDGTPAAQDKQLIADVGQRHVIGAETCNADSPRADCHTAVTEMAMMHFSYLNIDYEPNVIARYRSQGCFDTLDRQLGYRLRLLSASHSGTAAPGGGFTLRVTLHNDGWAAPINPRPVFALLDGPGGSYAMPIAADPRQWAAGSDVTIGQTLVVPPDVPPGTYRLALWLPDNYASLRGSPAYSIRFANSGVWDPTRGYNTLATGISVDEAGSSAPTAAPTVSTPAATRSRSAFPVAEAGGRRAPPRSWTPRSQTA
jgi:hypothetical protein